jgi:hypothetical protein
MSDLGLSFARPQALWLLLLIPVVALLGYRFGRRRGVKPPATWLRVASVALLGLALAEPMVSVEDTSSSTVFVIDRSSSLNAGTASSITEWVNEALDSAGSSDRAAVISFGASPELTSPSVEPDSVEIPGADELDVDADANQWRPAAGAHFGWR